MVVAENSGISNKKKLLEYLYTNPEKLAYKLLSYMKDDNGYAFSVVKLKGKGQGYYYSVNHKKLIRVNRNAEYYLLAWEDKENKDNCYIYSHHNWMVGCILRVRKSEIVYVGAN